MSFQSEENRVPAPPRATTTTGLGPLGLAFHERRKTPRRPLLTQGTLTVLDGPGAGITHAVQTRDLSISGICFLLRQGLSTGQLCRIEFPGSPARLCEITRSRPLSNGKYEMAAQFRKN